MEASSVLFSSPTPKMMVCHHPFYSIPSPHLLFGKDMDDARYIKVIDACALASDLDILLLDDGKIIEDGTLKNFLRRVTLHPKTLLVSLEKIVKMRK